MVIMEHCTTMSYKIKELLLRAWRERWNEIEFGRNLKRLLPPSVSGDVYDLADCILRQAITGPVPNALLMSYLNHCLCAQVVSFGAVILAITKITDPKPLCIFSFLEFIYKYKSRIICYGNEDECLALSRALVALLHWLYQIISISINEIQESKSQSSSTSLSAPQSFSLSSQGSGGLLQGSFDNIHLQIVRLASEMLNCLTSSSFLKTLLYVGKLEEPSLWSLWCKLYLEVNSKLVLLSDKSLHPIVQIISNFQSNVEWLSASMDSNNFLSSTPVASVAIGQITSDPSYIAYRPISYRSLHAVISFAAVLDLSSSIDVIANQLAMVGRFFDINLPQLYCESLHICLVNLIDIPKEDTKNLKNLHSWIPFFLYKIPRIFLILSKHRTKFCTYIKSSSKKDLSDQASGTDLEAGLDLLLERAPLLDLFDLRYSGEYFQKLLEEFEKHSLLSSKAQERFLENRKISGSQSQAEARQSSTSSPTSSMLIVRAEQTLLTVFNSLDSEVPMTWNLLGILCRMQRSFVVILCSAATTGILDKFAQKLVALNELNKMSTGETSQASQLRAFLFDITFLSLCVLVQNYGTELITKNPATKDSFFSKWCALNLPDNNRLSPELIMNSYNEPIKMDQHLNQFIVPNSNTEFKTSLVPWNEMCIVSQVAVSEMLTAWNSESISYELVMVFLERLKSRLCCLAVSGACWLFAQLKVVHHDQATKLMTMLNELNNISSDITDSSSDNLDNSTDTVSIYYKERSSLMLSIMNRLFSKHLPSKLSDKDGAVAGLSIQNTSYNNPSATSLKSISIPIRLSRTSLNVLLENALNSSKGQFNMKTIYEFDELMSLGGAHWFTNHLVRFLFQQNDITHLNLAVDLAFGLFHLDLEQCAIVLLRDILPRFLLYKPQQENLSEPIVTALVRLTVVTSFGAISQLESLKKCKLSRRCGHRRTYDVEIFEDGQIPDLKEESLHNTPYFFENPNPKSRSSLNNKSGRIVSGKNSPTTAMELDDYDLKSTSSSSSSVSDDILHEPIYIEWIRFMNLLLELSLDNEFNPRSLVPQAVLEQIVLCLREDSSKFLQFVSFDLLEGIIRSSPDMLTFEQLLSFLTLSSPRARKTGAHLLCQLQLSKIYGV